jgi:SWI/SNF-related matrix-associated actin-dependent regulator of chromatin subfamily A-like protein 1
MELYPYQRHGAKWLAQKDTALLADEMGLGKSAQIVAACDLTDSINVLVVCPAAARENWRREFIRFSDFPREITVISAGSVMPRPGVNIISYDLIGANKGLRDRLRNSRWDVVALDEAHYLKERTSKRTKAIYGHAQHPGIIHSARRVWRITGTPVLNFANELFTHLRSMGLAQVSYWDFVARYCTGFESNYGYKITGHKNTDELKALLEPHMLRRKKDEVLDLPPIYFVETVVEATRVPIELLQRNGDPLPQDIFSQINDLDRQLQARLDQLLNRSAAAGADAAIDVLAERAGAIATLRRHHALAKLPRALDLIEEELESGQVEKIVLFAYHRTVVEEAVKRLARFGAVSLYGGTPPDKRQIAIDSFQTGSARVFVGQLTSAGTAITLTAAHEVAFLESDWVPNTNAQAAMRCHRIGQTKPVRVRVFTCAKSVDEQISRALLIKTREISKIIA